MLAGRLCKVAGSTKALEPSFVVRVLVRVLVEGAEMIDLIAIMKT